ncbi:MAG TPA: hypothetical protein VFN26_10060 [Candidatus Acidoferrum sp.]|nr:hypothetical protein [Candidatus Acidoferrum sp.]
MKDLVPGGFVLVIVLRHIVRQAWHQRTSCRPLGGCHSMGGRTATVESKLYIEMKQSARESYNY